MSPGEVFRLEGVAVEFRLNAIHEGTSAAPFFHT